MAALYETLPAAAKVFHRFVAILFSILIFDGFTKVASAIPLICKPWPHSTHHVTKAEIISSFSKGTPLPDDFCAFCRDKHTVPLELPCGHIYCKTCLETLVESCENKCGPCRRQYYSLSLVELPDELQKKKDWAKFKLAMCLVHFAVDNICLAATIAILVVGPASP